ncbi:zinc finger CCHC domain-containing protein 8 [Clinocottus analis]|uniref:zinc finger CCHC domain-containing protein 8 n=1 Tax=Clinocottus analis TaxID=304258 RepID=UPI0035BF03B5
MAEVDFGDSELFQLLDDSALPVPTHIRFSSDEEDQEETSQLPSRLEECDDSIQRLTEENKELRRKLSILIRPSGITVEDVNLDGPVLQIMYANNVISKLCRQEIEDCVCSVILKHQKLSNEKKKTVFQMKPQHSAFALEEDLQKSCSSSVRTTTEAFKVVGSVQYFSTFSVDKLGQPLVNENPQLTDGWDIPAYHQVFKQVIGTDGQEIEMKDTRPKSMCFNCGLSGHQLRDCPKPKDMAVINERRKEFNQNNNNNNQPMLSNQRYHADEVEERFAKYKPGVMSEELLTAMGLDGNSLPPLIYRMRQLGYPPGWLKEAETENSGITLYEGNVSIVGKLTDDTNAQSISYDVSKLVEFPGFNVPASPEMKDEYMKYGSIPMQTHHLKDNYAAYLSKNFPKAGATCNKRRHESESSPQQRKKTRSTPDRNSDRSSDMDIESDPGTPYHQGHGDFQFQPPLPPGSPCFSSPPPLPRGTPPATPTPPPLPKGTPPPTPTNGSPALRGNKWVVVDDTADETEDELTLEELEEQQRLIWAALENADTATNSDCETPATETPVPSSTSVSTPVNVCTKTEVVEEMMDTTKPAGTCHTIINQREPRVQEIGPQSPVPVKAEDVSPQSPVPVKAQDVSPQSPVPVKAQDVSPQSPVPVKAQDVSPQSPVPVKAQDVSPQSPGPVNVQDVSPQSPGPVNVQDVSPQSPGPVKCEEDNPRSPNLDFFNDEKIAAVPHRSRFAAGIVPFEETPEFTEVAEATGTYLRIRDLLKSSPRSLAKKN